MDENSNNFSFDSRSIQEILTLRYDTTLTHNLPKLTWTDFIPKNNISLEFIEKQITNQITKQITNEDTKISLALSSGVDSTLILSIIKKKFPQINIETISIKFADSFDESESAHKIAEHFGVNHSVIYIENYLKELPKAISITKSPFWDLHWYYIVKKANSLSKYLISGDGGDELFGGYSFRYSKFLSLVDLNSTPLDKVKIYLDCHERDRVPDQENIFKEKMNFSWNSIYRILLPYFDNSLSPLDQVFLADYNGKLLYNFNPINSKLHDYFKINLIAPILSNEMIDYASHIPHNKKYDQQNNIGKLPLRMILKKFDMEKFVSTSKLGFSINTLNLWKTFGYKICKNYLSDARIIQDGLINKDWIEKYIDKDDLDIKYVNKFLGLLAFEVWYRLFVTKELKPNEVLE